MIGVSRPFRLLSDAGAILDKHEALIQTPPIGDTGREFHAIRTELVQAGRALEQRVERLENIAELASYLDIPEDTALAMALAEDEA